MPQAMSVSMPVLDHCEAKPIEILAQKQEKTLLTDAGVSRANTRGAPDRETRSVYYNKQMKYNGYAVVQATPNV